MKDIIFIVGVGRSGTTLLQNMLNSHPQVAFIPEINYTRRFLLSRNLEERYSKNKEKFINFLKNDKWFKRLDARIIDRVDFNNIDHSSFSVDFYKKILKINCNLHNKKIAGDKDPRSIEYVKEISKLLPNIHWIHIIRDPRDVLLSKRNADWSKHRSVLKHIFAGYIQLNLARKWIKLFPNKFTELYYEDLLHNPQLTLKNLCISIGLNYDSSMMDFKNSAQELIADDELSWKKEVFSSLNKENISKWKNGLSNRLIAFIEHLITPAFTHYNYRKSNPKINLIDKIQIVILKPLFFILSKVYIYLLK